MPMGSHSLDIGKTAPSLTFASGTSLDTIPETEGKYIIINFWSSDDPASRILNRRISDIHSSLSSSKVTFISVCMDNDDSLSKEIAAADKISERTISISVKDLSPQVTEDFQTASGNRSFIIDPFGNLADISPLPESIPSIIS